MIVGKFNAQIFKTMQRRKFMQQSLLAGGAILAPAVNALANDPAKATTNDDKPFRLNYGIHHGMFKNHAGDSFIDQIKFGYDNGFRAIEDNGMSGRSVD